MLPVQPEDFADVLLQLGNLVSIALTAKAAEAVDILTDLRRGKLHAPAQLLGGNLGHAGCLQLAQMTVIPGQAADHRV